MLPLRILRIRVARNNFARRIQFQQILCNVRNRFLRALFDLRPFRRTEPVQIRFVPARRDVTTQSVELMHRHIQAVALRVFEPKIFRIGSAQIQFFQTAKNADAVVNVHNKIAFGQIREKCFGRLRARVLCREAARFRTRPTKNFRVSEQYKFRGQRLNLSPQCETFGQRALHQYHVSRVGRVFNFRFGLDKKIALAQ